MWSETTIWVSAHASNASLLVEESRRTKIQRGDIEEGYRGGQSRHKYSGTISPRASPSRSGHNDEKGNRGCQTKNYGRKLQRSQLGDCVGLYLHGQLWWIGCRIGRCAWCVHGRICMETTLAWLRNCVKNKDVAKSILKEGPFFKTLNFYFYCTPRARLLLSCLIHNNMAFQHNYSGNSQNCQ